MNDSAPSPLTLPRALQPGDTLGVVAPAGPFDRESFNAGVAALQTMGFRLVVEDPIFQKQGYLAGPDQERAALVNRLFADPDIDGIICARGGYGAMRILPLLDAALISGNPKVFVGFSDITVLLNFLVDHCHLVAFHGPTVTTLGNGDPSTRSRFLAALTQSEAITLAAVDHDVIQPGSAHGPLRCGNLTLLCHLTGTPYQPDFNGCILLIEDRGEAPYRVDRMLTQMLLAGCMDGLAGLALGSFTDCGSAKAIRQIVADRLGELDIPILTGFEVGHGTINTTLPVGLWAHLDTHSRMLTVCGPAVRER